jgi:transcriptional regulator with XRE-family HTH domain
MNQAGREHDQGSRTPAVTGGSLSLGARLREERYRRGWSQRQMALRLFRAADEQTRARLPCTEHVVRRIVGYEGDAHRPRDPYAELYSRAFGIPRELLFGAADIGLALADYAQLPAPHMVITWDAILLLN